MLTTTQCIACGLTRRAVDHRIAVQVWQRVLPGVVAACSGHLTRRQRLIAAQLWGGSESLIDGIDACRFYGCVPRAATDEESVRIVVPWGSPARSQSFVKVRRTVRALEAATTDRLRFLAAPAAVVAAGRGMRHTSDVVALYSQALQTRIVSLEDLVVAHHAGSPRGRRRADPALRAVGGGARSPAEADARDLILTSHSLPTPLFNPMVQLPSGRRVSPDALIVESGLVHEVNSRLHHAREDLFESMQERHDAMTAAGLIVLHNPPRRIRSEASAVLSEIEATHARYAGRGLPDGVSLLPPR